MRLQVVKLVLLFLFFALILRLYYWQVVMADELSVKAESQRYEKLVVDAQRGDILYSDGTVLVSTQPTYLLYGTPKNLPSEQKVTTAKALARILVKLEKIPEGKTVEDREKELAAEFLEKLSTNLYWISLRKDISVDTKKEIEDGKVAGVGFEESFKRFYPESSSAAHLLGFVGSNSKGEGTGYFGVEGYYNGELKGIPGSVRLEKDALGVPILIGNIFTTKIKNGKSLTLNIDRVIQFLAEKSLKNGVLKYGAKSGSVVVMDPKTGAILALASYPDYDPGNFLDFPKESYKNPVVADSYEPGSTFKVLVMAAGVNEGLVESDTICDKCSGPVEVNDYTIKTWNNKYYPNTTMKDVIVHSDNTGMVFVSRKLGLDKMYSYIEDFGFGKPTEVDLQDESSPELREKDTWREIDLATASFGQGIAVTPIQMVRAVAAIANGGYLVEPHVVKEVRDDKKTDVISPKILKKVLKPETTEVMKEMMVAAVDEGESKYLKHKGFKIAGKTGTAQIPVAGHYDPNKTIASFVGFAPANDPKFIMLVRYDQPSTSIYGSETAAPTFFEIANELFSYYKLPPSE